MTTMAIQSAEVAPALEFAQSESRAVAVQSGLGKSLSQNAPRIASVLKLASSSAMLTKGIALGVATGPGALMLATGVLLLAAGGVMIAYGNKEKQKKRAEQMADEPPEVIPTDPVGRILHDIKKMASPAKYPIEAASGYGLIATACLCTAGFMMGRWDMVGVAVLSMVASAIALFGREKKKQAAAAESKNGEGLEFAESESKPVGIQNGLGKKLSGNPMLLSSIFLIANSIVAIYGGITKDDTFFTVAGVASLIANVLMAVFVRKNDYNVNAAKENAPAAPQTKVDASEAYFSKMAPQPEAGAALA